MIIEVETIVYVAGAILTIAGALGVIVKFMKKAITSISEEVTKKVTITMEARFDNKVCEVDTTLRKIIEENRKRDEETRFLTLKNSASRIFEAHSHYMRRGSITTFALANLEEIYSAYEAQNGNSHAKICMQQIRQLPIVEGDMEQRVMQEAASHSKH